jgi:hypothetical protein
LEDMSVFDEHERDNVLNCTRTANFYLSKVDFVACNECCSRAV